jgi:hypothetical protein
VGLRVEEVEEGADVEDEHAGLQEVGADVDVGGGSEDGSAELEHFIHVRVVADEEEGLAVRGEADVVRVLGRAAGLGLHRAPRAARGEEGGEDRAPSRVRGEQRAGGDARDEIAVHDDDGVRDEAIARRADRVRGVGVLGGGEDSDVARAPVRIGEPLAEDRRVRLAGGDEEDVADAAALEGSERVPHQGMETELEHVAGGVLRHERPEALLPAKSHDDALRRSHREIEADDRGGADAMCERRGERRGSARTTDLQWVSGRSRPKE